MTRRAGRPPTGAARPVRVTAPVRVADVGGWTDTWFAGAGAVCSLAVGPGIEVAAAFEDPDDPDRVDLASSTSRPVRIVAPDLAEDYRCGPSPATGWTQPVPGRHPLLEHAVATVCERHEPPAPVRVDIHAAVPPGVSLGTSAAVVVAVIAALDRLLGGPDAATTADTDEGRRHLVDRAHRVETDRVGGESGIQDQWAAAFGGAQLITMTEYPSARRRAIPLAAATVARLAETMVTIGVGRHDSTSVHRAVIAALTGPTGAGRRRILAELTALAGEAADALGHGDLDRWAATLTGATDAQIRLHAGLAGPGHRRVIDAARAAGATGWKINGAGGAGGSVTVVFAEPTDATAFAAWVAGTEPTFTVLDLAPAPGVRIERGDGTPPGGFPVP